MFELDSYAEYIAFNACIMTYFKNVKMQKYTLIQGCRVKAAVKKVGKGK